MIHLIVGNTGSGKTTYSQKLKRETKGVIFSIDKWNNTLFFPDMKSDHGIDWILDKIERIEAVILSLMKQLESANTDSILDLGLSKFEHREKFRKFAIENDFEIKLHYLDIPKKIRRDRIFKRNHEKGDTYEFQVTDENFDFMESWFEKPEGNELIKAIIIRNS